LSGPRSHAKEAADINTCSTPIFNFYAAANKLQGKSFVTAISFKIVTISGADGGAICKADSAIKPDSVRI